jgi:predicted DCC family thiol-disulfide oxidoreductase YuxK
VRYGFISISVNELENIGDRLLVIFDGNCGLCNGSVRWFLRRDRLDRLRFVPSDSPKVSALLARHGFEPDIATGNSGTILVAQALDTPAERLLIRSNAVLAILAQLPSPWPAFAACFRWIPRPLRDMGYRLIARWRYTIWGRLETCPIPTAEERLRFL